MGQYSRPLNGGAGAGRYLNGCRNLTRAAAANRWALMGPAAGRSSRDVFESLLFRSRKLFDGRDNKLGKCQELVLEFRGWEKKSCMGMKMGDMGR